MRISWSIAWRVVTLSGALSVVASAQVTSTPSSRGKAAATTPAVNAALLRTQLDDLDLPDSTRALIAGLRLRAGPVANGPPQAVIRFRSNVSIVVPVDAPSQPTAEPSRKRVASVVATTMAKYRLVARGDSSIHSLGDLREYLGELRAIGAVLLDSISNHAMGAQAIETALRKPTLNDLLGTISARPEVLLGLEADIEHVDDGLAARILFRLLVEHGKAQSDSLLARRDTTGRAAQIDALEKSTESGDRDRRQLIALWAEALREQTTNGVVVTQSGVPKDFAELENSAMTVRLAGAIGLAPGFTIDDVYRIRAIPDWLEFRRALGSNLPVWTTRWEKEGTLLTADPGAGAAASLSVRSELSPRSPEMELGAPLNRSIAVVTGTYSTATSRVVGLTYTMGKLAGGLIQPWDGLCFIAPSGRLFISRLGNVELGTIAASLGLRASDDERRSAALTPLEKSTDLRTLVRFIEHHQLTLFQSHLLLYSGRLQVSQRPPTTGRRLLVEFPDGRFGILTLGGSGNGALGFTLAEAATVAARIGAVSALNLDTGAWNKGWIEAGGQRVAIGDGGATLAQLSNVLRVFHHPASDGK